MDRTHNSLSTQIKGFVFFVLGLKKNVKGRRSVSREPARKKKEAQQMFTALSNLLHPCSYA